MPIPIMPFSAHAKYKGRWSAVLLFLSTVLSIGVCELWLRMAAPAGEPFLTHPPNLHLELKPSPSIFLYATSPSRFTTDDHGFRVSHQVDYRHKPRNVLRVFLVGGSTTEGFYTDDAHTFGYLLERALRRAGNATNLSVEVINTGRGGTCSADHYYLATELVKYEPDLIVYLMGVNDMIGYLRSGFQPTASPTKAWIRSVLMSSQLIRRITFLYRNLSAEGRIMRDDSGDTLVLARERRQTTPSGPMPPPAKTVPDHFRHNVRLLAKLHRDHGIRAIFMTQPTMWRAALAPELDRLLTNTPGAIHVRYSTAEMDEVMERYNDVLRATARSEPLISLLDLSRLLPKDTTVFYDDVHFHDLGHKRIAALLSHMIIDEGLLDGPTETAPRRPSGIL